MSRLPNRVLAVSLSLASAALAACATPTAPTPNAKSLLHARPNNSPTYESIQPDSTCRTGFSVGNARTCT